MNKNNLRNSILHFLDLPFQPKSEQRLNEKNQQPHPDIQNESESNDINNIHRYSMEMKSILRCLDSELPEQRKLGSVLLALFIGNMNSYSCQALLFMLKHCFLQGYIFINFMKKASLIRKKDVEAFNPTPSKKSGIVMHSMPLIQFPSGEYYTYDRNILRELVLKNELEQLPDLLTSIIWLDSSSISIELLDLFKSPVPMGTFVNNVIESSGKTPIQSRNSNNYRIIIGKSNDKKSLRDSDETQITYTKSINNTPLHYNNHEKSDDSGEIYTTPFIVKVLKTQMENKRRKSTFRYLKNGRHAKKSNLKMNKRRGVNKCSSTKLGMSASSKVKRTKLSHFASFRASSSQDGSESRSNKNHNKNNLSKYSEGQHSRFEGDKDSSIFSLIKKNSHRQARTMIETLTTPKIDDDRRVKMRVEKNLNFFKRKHSRRKLHPKKYLGSSYIN